MWHDCPRPPQSSELSDARPWGNRFGLRDYNSEEGWSSVGSDEEPGSDAASDELACPAVVEEEVRWEDWEERVEEHRRTRPPSRAACAASTVDMCVLPTEQSQDDDREPTLDKGNAKQNKKHMEKYLTPCMQTIRPEPKDKKKKHREKLASREIPFNLKVARPVGRQEMSD